MSPVAGQCSWIASRKLLFRHSGPLDLNPHGGRPWLCRLGRSGDRRELHRRHKLSYNLLDAQRGDTMNRVLSFFNRHTRLILTLIPLSGLFLVVLAMGVFESTALQAVGFALFFSPILMLIVSIVAMAIHRYRGSSKGSISESEDSETSAVSPE